MMVLKAAVKGDLIDSWREAITVPIYKKGDWDLPACYRPISLIDPTAQILGWVILDKLESWAEDSSFFSPVQYGVHPGLGTVEQAINRSQIWGKYVKARRGALHMAFMDLFCVFDLVDRGKLWALMD